MTNWHILQLRVTCLNLLEIPYFHKVYFQGTLDLKENTWKTLDKLVQVRSLKKKHTNPKDKKENKSWNHLILQVQLNYS